PTGARTTRCSERCAAASWLPETQFFPPTPARLCATVASSASSSATPGATACAARCWKRTSCWRRGRWSSRGSRKREMVMKKAVLTAAGLLLASLAHADVAATGEAIAAALNKRDVNATLRQIDADAVGRAVIKDLGLNTADRDTVLKVFPNALRTNVELGIRTIDGTKGTAKYMRSGERNGRPFALLRYDLGDQGIDYVEYYLGKTDKVEDWYVHSLATLFSTSARLGLSSLLKTDSMLFSLFGSRMTTQADAKPFIELRASLQKQDFAAAYRTLESFPEDFRKTRQWALMRVAYGGRVDGDTHRAALRYLAQNFGKDPELQFMLIDHFFFEKQFDGALAALGALERA